MTASAPERMSGSPGSMSARRRETRKTASSNTSAAPATGTAGSTPPSSRDHGVALRPDLYEHLPSLNTAARRQGRRRRPRRTTRQRRLLGQGRTLSEGGGGQAIPADGDQRAVGRAEPTFHAPSTGTALLPRLVCIAESERDHGFGRVEELDLLHPDLGRRRAHIAEIASGPRQRRAPGSRVM